MGETFSTKCTSEKDRKLLTNLRVVCNKPSIFYKLQNWVEQERVAIIRKLQTQFSQLAPELEITPKINDTHKEDVDKEF